MLSVQTIINREISVDREKTLSLQFLTVGVFVHKRFGFHSTKKKRNYEKSVTNFKIDFYSYKKPLYLQHKEHATAFTRFRKLHLNVKPFRDLHLIPKM